MTVVGAGGAWPSIMTSERIDYDALAATTSIEDMNDDCEPSQETLRSLKSGRLLELQICNQPMGVGEYGVFSDMELGWLGGCLFSYPNCIWFVLHVQREKVFDPQ